MFFFVHHETSLDKFLFRITPIKIFNAKIYCLCKIYLFDFYSQMKGKNIIIYKIQFKKNYWQIKKNENVNICCC